MKKRNEIENIYKWDLSCYIKDEEMMKKEFEYLEKTYPIFKNYYGIFNDKNKLLEFFKLNDEFEIRFDRLACYIYHSLDEDKSNTFYLSYMKKLEFLSKDVSELTAFVSPQLLDLDENYLKELINDENFEEYKRELSIILRNKEHKLSEHDSELISKMSLFLSAPSDIFDALTTGEIKFEDINLNGEEFEVNEANYSKLMSNKNREVRRLALKNLMLGYAGKNKTITTAYLSDIQSDIFMANLKKFSSVKEQCLFYEEVDEKVYNRLIEQINKNVCVLHNIAEAKRKALGLDKIAYYDLMVPLSAEKHYNIDEAVALVREAVKPLGEEYQTLICEKFNEKVIDYLPNENKETGAYSSGCYGCPSVVLMNYVEDLRSVYTLAHEIGHAMHSEFSNRFQPYSTSQYKIFVAEVASTVNEILLYNYLIKDADENTKKALTFDILDEFRSTVFRQTMFSEFESKIHEELENKVPLTYEDLNNYYYELNKKYFGENVELPCELKYEWSRIPHFYRPFYVYKYATGFISALCIVEKLLTEKDYYKKYINFLKSGSSKGVIDLLKDIDVDLTTDKPYEIAFKYLKEQLNNINS